MEPRRASCSVRPCCSRSSITGMARDDAYRRRPAAAAKDTWDRGLRLPRPRVGADPATPALLSRAELDALFDPSGSCATSAGCSSDSRSSRWRARRERVTRVLRASGKVRDLYEAGHDRLLLVATDRISAFDVVLPTPIPDKGRVLTGLLALLVRPDGRPRRRTTWSAADRAACRRLRRRPGRARDARAPRRRRRRSNASRAATSRGSGWTQYRPSGVGVRRARCPPGLVESDRLPEPIFTPDDEGRRGPRPAAHARARRATWSGAGLAERLKELTLTLYERAAGDRARARHHPGRHEVRVRLHARAS